MGNFISAFNRLKEYKDIKSIMINISSKFYMKIGVCILLSLVFIPIIVMLSISLGQSNGKYFMYILLLIFGEIGIIMLVGYKLKQYFLFKKLNSCKYYMHHFLLLMLCWAFISTLIQLNNFNSWIGDLYRNEGFFTYLAYAGIYGISVILFNERYRSRVLYMFVLVSNVLSILTILEFNGVAIPFFASDKVGYSAIFHNLNHFGYYLLMSGMVAAGLFVVEQNKKLKSFSLISLCIIITTLIINDTFGCYLGFLAGVIFLPIVLIVSQKRLKLIYFIPLILFGLLTLGVNKVTGTVDSNMEILSNDITKIVTQEETANNAGSGRWVLWTNAIDFIKQKPWFGHGLDSLGPLYNEVGINMDRPHNEYLQHAAHLGVPALIFYLCALTSIYIRAFKNRIRLSATTLVALCAVGAYLVSAFFGNTMYYTTPYFVMLLGMSTKIGKSEILEEC